MASRHDKCKEPVKLPVRPPVRLPVKPLVKPPVKPIPNSNLVRPKAVFKATASHESLVEENNKLKEEVHISLAANKKMEDEILGLTKRNEELTIANNNLAKALATEQSNSKGLLDLNENTKSLMNEITKYAKSQKVEFNAELTEMLMDVKKFTKEKIDCVHEEICGNVKFIQLDFGIHRSLMSTETKCVKVQNIEAIEALQDYTRVRTDKEHELWHSKLKTKQKQNEMAKYLSENVFEENLKDALIESLKLMFWKDCFVRDISFRDEKDRIYFKKSNLLKALQISLAEKYTAEETTIKVIQKKIRNFKDALSKNPKLWVESNAEITELNTATQNFNGGSLESGSHNVNGSLESPTQDDSGTSSTETEQVLTFCLCKRPEFGEMILCENDLCRIKWYHFPCVSVMMKPRGKWYCPNCRGAVEGVKSKKCSRKPT